ncbi:Rab GTPase domain-containing protein [Heterostelium album PN500]|uniref:Rab GTPase domain-containing protein n=1 Tax=Heterostelium pallidum (strain ATCC 26659 / Pp 5 / PN500) TaxID=670386 RepID=D3BAK1_HETP5|nr:Rab GTPase domain-containing protein [Heterostelium album PN500]EFA81588.1 Rab GTPase domain-containing protein [Heterostelium album PN500]|eukprot:XP_020433705.1 Rab GTPase domain-containing protein [Heterostelium album PN500]
MKSFFSNFTKSSTNNNNSLNNNSSGVGNNNNSSSSLRASLLSTNSFDSFNCFDKVRIAVVGDTTVGKTSLVNLICKNQVIDSPSWTCGCNTDIKIHEYHSKDYFIEFLDVGGSAKYKITRSLFYSGINGLIVVYDVTNKNSLSNVKKWIFEVLNKISTSTANWQLKETENPKLLELENIVHQNNKAPSIPLLILGNKSDLYHDGNYIANDKLGKLSISVIISNMLAGSKRRTLGGISQGVFSFNIVTPSTSTNHQNNNYNNNNAKKNGGIQQPTAAASDFGPQDYDHLSTPQSTSITTSSSSTIERPLYLNHQNIHSLSPTLPLTIHDLNNDNDHSNDNIFYNENFSPPNNIPSTSLPMFLSSHNNNNNNNYNDINTEITISPLRTPHRTRSTSFERKWNK